jgi:hypothetical protein
MVIHPMRSLLELDDSGHAATYAGMTVNEENGDFIDPLFQQ